MSQSNDHLKLTNFSHYPHSRNTGTDRHSMSDKGLGSQVGVRDPPLTNREKFRVLRFNLGKGRRLEVPDGRGPGVTK